MSSTPSNSTSTGGGLSAGAAAGIGVGATLCVLAAGLIIYFFIRSYRQKKHGAPDIPAGEVGGPERNPAELGQDSDLGKMTGMVTTVIQPEIAEMGQGLSLEEYDELGRRRRAAELSGRPALPAELMSSPRAELEARRADAGIFHEMADGVER